MVALDGQQFVQKQIKGGGCAGAPPEGATGCTLTASVDFSYRIDGGTPPASAGIKVAADVPHRAVMPDSTGKIVAVRSKAVSGTLCFQFIQPRS